MKNIVKAILVLAIVSSCQQQQKIGFVDNGELINNYKMKIEIEDAFKVKDEAFQKRMDSISRDFQVEAQAFQMAADKMSQKDAQEKYNTLGQKQQVLQQQFQLEQQQMQKAFSVEIDSVLAKVKDFVKDYGKKNGYSFILGQNEAGSVMYGEEASDITKALTEALNAAYKPEAGAEANKQTSDQ
jgi:outer membrane protein